VAIVTGAASGIGKGVAEFLAQKGAKVVVCDIDRANGEAVAAALGERGTFIPCDVTSAVQCQEVAKKTSDSFGRIDILVNCAGVIVRKDVVETSEEEWDRVLNVNLKGTFLMSKYVIAYMARNGGGNIVNIGSGWGLKGGPKAAVYCASKAGVVNLTRAMAIDHGPQNIRVNCVCPGDIETPMLISEARQLGMDVEKFLRECADRPLARLGTPLDVAKAVYFFVSDLSPWVTGAVLVVDGGGLA